MPRSTAATRIAPLAGLLLLALGSFASPTVRAADPEPATVTEEASSTSWGPIVGACFGVLFGGVLALWQIRNMKNRG